MIPTDLIPFPGANSFAIMEMPLETRPAGHGPPGPAGRPWRAGWSQGSIAGRCRGTTERRDRPHSLPRRPTGADRPVLWPGAGSDARGTARPGLSASAGTAASSSGRVTIRPFRVRSAGKIHSLSPVACGVTTVKMVWRRYGDPSRAPGSRTLLMLRRSRRRRSRGPGPGWRPGARDRGRTRRTACRRPRCPTAGRRTSPTRRRS